MKNKICQTNC